MDLFSISQLAEFSGIKAHTIRIWEQRYNALKPNRSEGNTRYYDNAQLRRLLNIVSLNSSGYKISELCVMPDKALFKLIEQAQKDSHSGEPYEYFISQLVSAGMNYDEQHFEQIFAENFKRFGMKDGYTKVIYPMLVRLGLMWSADTLPAAYEHFISNLLRQKIFSAINSLPAATSSSNTWLLFLPENELHEIGLLFSSYLIKLSGKKVIYLGSNVPQESLHSAIKQLKPDNLLFFIVHKDIPENIQSYCENLLKNFSGKKIFLAVDEKITNDLKLSKKINLLHSIESLEQKLSFI